MAGESGALKTTSSKAYDRGNAGATQDAPSRSARVGGLWASLGVIVVLSLVGYGHLLVPGQVPFNRHSDFIAQHLTTKTVLYESLRAGRGIPLWRNDQFSGYTGLTSPQTMYTYPLHALFALLPAVEAAGPTDYLHFLAAGVAFYVLGAVLGLGRWPRVFLAAAGMFNFKLLMAAYAGWTPVVPIIVWVPGLLAAVIHAVKRPGAVGAAALGVVGAVCLHCGQIQLLYYFAWFGVAYAVVAVGQLAWRREWREAGRTVLWLSVGGVLAVAMAAYLLAPMVVSSGHSTRTAASFAFFQAGRPLGPAHLLTFLYPEVLGTPLDNSYKARELWEDVAYFGVVPLVLAALAARWGWRRPHTRFLVVALAVSAVLAFNTPLTVWAYHLVPGFKLFRIPNRFLFLSATFGIALAGVGLEELLARAKARRGPGGAGVAVALAAIVLVAAEGTYYARRYLTTVPQAQAMPPPELTGLFAKDRSLHRVACLNRTTLNAGWSAPMKIQSVGGYDGFNYAHYRRYMDLMRTGRVQPLQARVWFEVDALARADMLDALNVRYFVSPAPLVFPEGGMELVATLRGTRTFAFYYGLGPIDLYVYRNHRCMDRAWWAGRVIPAADPQEMALLTERNNLHTCAIVLSKGAGDLAESASEGDRLELTSWQPGRVVLATRNAAPRVVVVSEMWDPGWRATIDGRAVAVHLANITMMGVAVPAGEHQVVLEYVPPTWPAALGVTIAGVGLLVVLVGVAAVGAVRARRGRGGGQAILGDSRSRR